MKRRFPLTHRPEQTRSLILLFGFVLLVPMAQAQDGVDSLRVNPYGSGIGAQVLLTNSGFGLGGYVHDALSPSLSFLFEGSVQSGKNEREVTFFDRLGQKEIPDKANYLLMIPLQIGFQQRLFQESIEDNFRPHLQLIAGPTLGWQYPYFEDRNRNGIRELDEPTLGTLSSLSDGAFRFGLGATIALGANFGRNRSLSQGVRIGYTFTYFFQGIQLLEPNVQGRQNFFGSPTISIQFGRLF